MSRKVLAITLMLSVGVLTTACAQNVAEKVIESQIDGKVKHNSNRGSVEIEEKNGRRVTIWKNRLPADFPKDVPIYKPSSIKRSISNTFAGKKTFQVTLTTSDDLNAVIDFYKAGFSGDGWTEAVAFSGDQGGSRYATRGYNNGETGVALTFFWRNNTFSLIVQREAKGPEF